MKILVKTTLWVICGYLAVAAFAPGVSFWKEFFMILSAPFILFCQIIPSAIFNSINSLSEYIIEYSRMNSDAKMLGWVGLIVGFVALFATLIYYIVLIITVPLLFNKLVEPSYKNETPAERNIREYIEDRPLTDGEKEEQAFWENQQLNAMGLITNKELIDADVQANAIARALRKY